MCSLFLWRKCTISSYWPSMPSLCLHMFATQCIIGLDWILILTGVAFSLKATLPGTQWTCTRTHTYTHVHTYTMSVNQLVISLGSVNGRGVTFSFHCLGGEPWPSHRLCSATLTLSFQAIPIPITIRLMHNDCREYFTVTVYLQN